MKNVARAMAIRMGIYGILTGYLVFDFFYWQGPLYRSLKKSPRNTPEAIAEAKADGVVARVYFRPIYRRQVEESLHEYLWRRGQTIEETSAGERRVLRLLIVNELIDDELLKLQIKVSTSEEVAVADDQIDRAVEEERARYHDPSVFPALAERAGWQGEKEQEMRVAARIQRAEHISRLVQAKVTDEEVREWFDRYSETLEGDFEANREAIRDALHVIRKDEGWQKFRLEQLRRRADGKIDLFKDALFAGED
ncbi:MAG: hypothetical protein ACON4R_09240 [Akkermansiaceae bacterium]